MLPLLAGTLCLPLPVPVPGYVLIHAEDGEATSTASKHADALGDIAVEQVMEPFRLARD